MKVAGQIFSLTSLMPTFCPANTILRLILRRPTQIRSQWVTVMVRSWKGFQTTELLIGPRRGGIDLDRMLT